MPLMAMLDFTDAPPFGAAAAGAAPSVRIIKIAISRDIVRTSSCPISRVIASYIKILDLTLVFPVFGDQILTPFNRSALPMTLTDDRAIAAAAMIGETRTPKTG